MVSVAETATPAREARNRSVIAAIGPLLGSTSLDHPSARADRRSVDLNREPGWGVDAWRWLSTERARDLARHEPFAYTWRLLVVRLHDLGDEYVELRGNEVDRFLAEATDTGSVLSVCPSTSLFSNSWRLGRHSRASTNTAPS